MSPAVKRDLGDLLSRLTAEETDRREYGRLLVALTGALTAGARVAGARAALTGRWLTDVVVEDVAPHLPVRDLLTLRTHHGGRSGDDLAQALIRNAAITTSSLGAAAGALAAAEMVAPPTLLAAPFQLAAETLAVIAIEVKLVAELHVVYGQAPVGTRSQVATAYLTAWAARGRSTRRPASRRCRRCCRPRPAAAAPPGGPALGPQPVGVRALPRRCRGRRRAEPPRDARPGRDDQARPPPAALVHPACGASPY